MVAHWKGNDKQYANSVSPLLIGAQGCGKSTYCRNLLPPDLRAYYTDSIDFSRKRDAELYLNRFMLINMDEFDQVSANHQGFLKHILQKPVLNVRKPNESAVSELKRYASFIATSNHSDLLSDPSGVAVSFASISPARSVMMPSSTIRNFMRRLCKSFVMANVLISLPKKRLFWWRTIRSSSYRLRLNSSSNSTSVRPVRERSVKRCSLSIFWGAYKRRVALSCRLRRSCILAEYFVNWECLARK